MISIESLPWKKLSQSFSTQADEQLLASFDTHWIKYARPTCAYALIMGIVGGLTLLAVRGLENPDAAAQMGLMIAMPIALLTHQWFFYRLLSEAMEDIVITNKRLIFRETHLWISNDMHEIALARIRAVEVCKHGILHNLLRFGTLWFDTGGGTMESGKVLPLVPKPEEKSAMILRLLEMK